MRPALSLAAACLFVAATGAAAAPDPALKTFLAAFGEALRRSSLEAAAGMAHFPLENSAYQQPKTIAKSGFRQHFGYIKGKEFADCLKTTAPQPAAKASRTLGDWSVDCNGNVFYFKPFDGQWRYSGYENVNE
jgi:hypothetical protein